MSGLTPEERLKYVGASEVSCILGLNSFKSHRALWNEKAGLSPPENMDKKLHVKLGNHFEQGIIDLFNKEPALAKMKTKGLWKVEPAGQVYWKHPFVKGMGASPDAFGTSTLHEGRGVFDCKFTSGWGVDIKHGKREWHWQLQQQMACAPEHFDYGAILMVSYAKISKNNIKRPELDMRAFVYPRDEDMMNTCEIVIEDFWKSIRDNNPPPYPVSYREE